MAENEALQPTNLAELGKALVAEAQEQDRKRAQTLIVSTVQSILADVREQERIVAFAQKRLTQQKARLAALESGAFTVDPEAGLRFVDQDLNGGGL